METGVGTKEPKYFLANLRHFISRYLWLSALSLVFVPIFFAVTGCLLLLSYLFNNPAQITPWVKTLYPSINILVSDALINDEGNLVLQGVNLRTTGVDFRSNNIEIAFYKQADFPYMQIALRFANPSVRFLVEENTQQEAKEDFDTFAWRSYADQLFIIQKFFRRITVEGGKVYIPKDKGELLFSIDGHMARLPTTNSWHASFDGADEKNNKWQMLFVNSFDANSGYYKNNITITDSLFVRHFAFVDELLDVGGSVVKDAAIKSSIDIVIDKNWQKWQIEGGMHVADAQDKALTGLNWRASGNLQTGNFITHVQDASNTKLNLYISATSRSLSARLSVAFFDMSSLRQFSPWLRHYAHIEQLQGSFSETFINVTFAHSDLQSWRVTSLHGSSDVDNVGYTVAASSQAPYFTGISGSISFTDTLFNLSLASDNFTLYLPNIFAYPLAFTDTKGIFTFNFSESLDALHVTTKDVFLTPTQTPNLPDSKVNLFLDWTVAKGGQKLLLDIGLKEVHAEVVRQVYFPSTKFPHISTFLQNSLHSGILRKGNVRLALDFTKGSVNVDTDIGLNFINAVFNYPDLPTITEGDVSLTVGNKKTDIYLSKASMGGIELQDASMSIGHDKAAIFSLHGMAVGEVSDLRNPIFSQGHLHFFFDLVHSEFMSPMQGKIAATIEFKSGIGKVEVPPLLAFKVDVRDLQTDDLYGQRLDKLDVGIDYDSRVGITDIVVNSLSINGNSLSPRKIGNSTIIENLPVALNDYFILPNEQKKVKGSLSVDLDMRWNKELQTLRFYLTPEFRNLLVEVPFFIKPASVNWQSKMLLELDFHATIMRLQLLGFVENLQFVIRKQGKSRSGCVLFDEGNKSTSSALGYINSELRRACQADTNSSNAINFIVRKQKASINELNELLTWLGHHKKHSLMNKEKPTNTFPPEWLGVVAIDVESFVSDVASPSWLRVRGSRSVADKDNYLMEVIASDWLEGKAKFNANKINIELDRLLIEKQNTTDDITTQATSEVKPPDPDASLVSVFPALDIVIKSLYLDSYSLGSVYAEFVPYKNNTLNAQPNTQADDAAHMQIRLQKGSSVVTVNGTLTQDNITKLNVKAAIKHEQIVNSVIEKASISGFMSWRGSPFNYNTRSLNADLRLQSENIYIDNDQLAYLKKLDIFGLLSIVGIVELLDLQAKNKTDQLLLKEIKAHMLIKQGVASYKEPASVEAIGFSAVLDGEGSLVTGDVDMNVIIALRFNRTLNFALLVGTYPVVIVSSTVGGQLTSFIKRALIDPVSTLSYRMVGNIRRENGINILDLTTIKQ